MAEIKITRLTARKKKKMKKNVKRRSECKIEIYKILFIVGQLLYVHVCNFSEIGTRAASEQTIIFRF